VIVAHSSSAIAAYPHRAFQTWALATPAALVISTLALGQVMRRVVASAVGNAARSSSPATTAAAWRWRAAWKPTAQCALSVEGFFDDRGSDRLNMEADTRLVGRLSDLAAFAKEHTVDVIFIALPVRHIKRVLDLLDDLRDTTARSTTFPISSSST